MIYVTCSECKKQYEDDGGEICYHCYKLFEEKAAKETLELRKTTEKMIADNWEFLEALNEKLKE